MPLLLNVLEIESPQNAKIKVLARLRDKRGRTQQGKYLIDGLRECIRAVQSGAPIEALVCCPELLSSQQLETLHQSAVDIESSTPVWHLSRAAFDKVAYGERAEGVVAVAASQDHPLKDLRLPENPLIVVVERIEKPGNLGAVFRTADSVGADAVVIADAAVDAENPNVIRASLGTIFEVPFAMAETNEVLSWLSEHQIQSFAARVDATQYYHQVDYKSGTAIVLGSEADGLSDAWHRDSVTPIKIPMNGIADSLNISVSAAVILYEAARQRSFNLG